MEQLVEFLREYVDFFEEMERKQEEKLQKWLSRELSQIEETIMMQQAMDKRLENMERRRSALFEQLGYGGFTFKELIAAQGKEAAKELIGLNERLEHAVGNIRFYNEKASGLAQAELEKMGAGTGTAVTKTGGIYKPEAAYRRSMLERKV